MNIKISRKTILLLCTFCVVLSGRSFGGENQIDLEKLLNKIPSSIGLRFTIENAYADGEKFYNISSRQLPEIATNTITKNEVLDTLGKMFPEASIEVSVSEPNVIHIMDKRLHRFKGYALDQVLLDCEFTGTPHELLKYISKTVPSLQTMLALAVHRLRVQTSDRVTQVKFSGAKIVVRDALTNYLPLERYKNVLWVASTSLNRNTTQVEFLGPITDESKTESK